MVLLFRSDKASCLSSGDKNTGSGSERSVSIFRADFNYRSAKPASTECTRSSVALVAATSIPSSPASKPRPEARGGWSKSSSRLRCSPSLPLSFSLIARAGSCRADGRSGISARDRYKTFNGFETHSSTAVAVPRLFASFALPPLPRSLPIPRDPFDNVRCACQLPKNKINYGTPVFMPRQGSRTRRRRGRKESGRTVRSGREDERGEGKGEKDERKTGAGSAGPTAMIIGRTCQLK